jgi:hypothetical protein
MAEIKPEGDDAHVKPEPLDPLDLQAPAADEEDLYEDAGDLEFYDPNADGNRFEALYLARLPKYLWDSWAKLLEGLDDDNEVRIGTLRTWSSQDSQGQEVSLNGRVPDDISTRCANQGCRDSTSECCWRGTAHISLCP